MAFETQIFGICEHQYQPVYEALAKILADPAELGGSITVFIDGKPVIDLWGGYADQHRSKLWQHDTLCCQWSVGKPLAALLLLLLSDRGQLDLNAPVREYWPEFSQFGKDHITIQQVMTHTDGLGMLPGIVRGDVYDWKKMVRGIEQAEREIVDGSPSWQTVAYGQMCGEIVKRVSGSSIGEFWRSEIAEAHGVDFYFGLTAEEQKRCAYTVDGASPLLEVFNDPTSIFWPTTIAMPFYEEHWNSDLFRSAEIPAANGHGTTYGLAKLFCKLAMSEKLGDDAILSADTLAYAIKEAWEGEETHGLFFRLSNGGFHLRDKLGLMTFDGGERTFGCRGMSENIAFANPDAGIGFSYTTNRVTSGSTSSQQSQHTKLILDAFRRSLS